MESLDDVILTAEEKMEKTLSFLQQEFAGLRTGKASPALVENVKVAYYGSTVRLKEIAGISTPDTRLIVVTPYDPTALADIEKAILAANIGITPMNDGRVIRAPVPELSEERRKELSKVARRMAEDARIAIRNERRDANEAVKKIQKEGKASEDDCKSASEQIQKDTGEYIKTIDELLKAKEAEIMAV